MAWKEVSRTRFRYRSELSNPLMLFAGVRHSRKSNRRDVVRRRGVLSARAWRRVRVAERRRLRGSQFAAQGFEFGFDGGAAFLSRGS